MRADNEPRTKRPKNKQDRPAMSDSEDIPSNDEDRKPAARNTTYYSYRTAYLAHALAQTKAQGTRTESVVSTSAGNQANPSSRLRLHLPTTRLPTKLKLPLTVQIESHSHSAPESRQALIPCILHAATAKYRGTVIEPSSKPIRYSSHQSKQARYR
jgi:hypothetical protein